MRRAAKVDARQGEIVDALRKAGYLVRCTHQVGGGFPDLVCLAHGHVFLFEVKADGGKLTKREREFFGEWGESNFVHVVRSPIEALNIIEVETLPF